MSEKGKLRWKLHGDTDVQKGEKLKEASGSLFPSR